jgi:hypothetical protein
MQQSIRYLSLVVVLGIDSGSALAQTGGALQATAALDRKEIQLGQSAVVIVQYSGSNGRPEITPPKSADCSITLAGRPIRSIATPGNGRKDGQGPAGQNLTESIQKLTDALAKDPLLNPDALERMGDADLKKQLQAALDVAGAKAPDEHALAYHVHVRRTGTIVIPPFTVTANGETITTKPLDLHVSPARNQDYVRLAMSLSEPRPVVGQEAHVYVDVLVRREEVHYQNQTYPHLPLSGVHISLPPLGESGLEPVRPLVELMKEHAPAQGHRGYRVNHLPGEAVFDKEPAGARLQPNWYRRRFEIPVRFNQIGTFSLPGAGVAGEVLAAGQSSGRKTAMRREAFTALSEPLTWEVRALPAGQPRDFSGNIGALKVTATASHTKMTAGTPFTLTVRLEGEGYLPRSGSVEPGNKPEFASRFRVLPNAERVLSDTLRETTFTLRPLSPDVKEVPPLSVPYFDTKTDQFRTAKSTAIALEVADAANVASEIPPAGFKPAENSDQSIELKDLIEAHAHGRFTRNLLPAAALTGAFGLTTAVLLVGLWKRGNKRRSDRVRLPRTRRATDDIRRRLSQGVESVRDVRELLQRALREQFHLPPGEITSQDAADRLQKSGVAGALADECARLLEACAVGEFAPGVEAPPLADLITRAERWTAQVSKFGRSCVAGA